MAHIQFFEKPGCINNTKQKSWLEAAGHQVQAENILDHPWSAEGLKSFFKDKPIAEWFNMTAPVIKSGELNPGNFSAEAALEAMVNEPILIKRPLMVIDNTHYIQGFDKEKLHDLIGLTAQPGTEGLVHELNSTDLTTCPKLDTGMSCDDEKDSDATLRPLGDVVELVRAMGLDVSYAYEDLAFIEHNAFLFRFEQGRRLSLYFNVDCDEDDAKKLEQQVVALGTKGNLIIERKGIYAMIQIEGESNLEIKFIDDKP